MSNLRNIINLMGRVDNAFYNTMLLDESLLLEAYSLADVYQKYYSHIESEIFNKIVGADPTSGADKMGKYSKWLLWLYQKNNLKLEDLYKATDYLTTFDKFKNKIPNGNDIGMYKSLPQLYMAIQPFEGQKTHGEEIREIKGDAENYKKVLNLYDTQKFSWAFPLNEVSYVMANQPYGTFLQNSSFLCVVFENETRMIFDVHNGKFVGEITPDIIDIKPLIAAKKIQRYSKNLAVYTTDNGDETNTKIMFGIFDMARCQKLSEPIYFKTFYEPLTLNREGYKFGEEHNFLAMKKPHNQTNLYNADYQNSDVLFYDGRIFKLPEFMQIAQRLYDEWLSKHPEQSQGK